MTDWISFVVALGFVVPWLLTGACLLVEWACKALTHCRRMRTDAIYRDVDSQFKADLAEAGSDGRTIRVRSILWWSSVVATACLLLSDVGWIISMEWLWAMSAPMVVLEIAAILVAAVCLNLTTVSFASRLRPRRDPMDRSDSDDSDDWEDILRAAEALSARYDAIVARPAGGLSKRDRDRRAGRTPQPVWKSDTSAGTGIR